jgi:DNA repair protein RecN (Recombination protein N)
MRDLAALGRLVADVTSQHESVTLIDPHTHLDFLDEYAGLMGERAEITARVREIERIAGAIREIEDGDGNRAEREEFLRYQLEQIDAIGPREGEQDELRAELSKLKHGERLRGTAARAVGLFEREDSGGICDELGRIASELSAAADIDDLLRGAADEVGLCWTKLTEVSRELGDYADRVDADPARLEDVQDRLFKLERLARQHGQSVTEVLSARERIVCELDSFEARGARLPQLRDEYRAKLEVVGEIAVRLSRKRHDAAKKLGRALTAELGDLGMLGARLVIQVASRPAQGAELRLGGGEVDGMRLFDTGIDRVELLIAANRGSEPRPLAQVASGGELSRLLLALRRVSSTRRGGERSAGIIVLDEIDVGVGGETGDRIGRAIASSAKERQVLCITHLASIAAHADAQFVVRKVSDRSSTTTTAMAVGGDDRVTEIARMLTGSRTGSTERAARELLSAAHRGKGAARAA